MPDRQRGSFLLLVFAVVGTVDCTEHEFDEPEFGREIDALILHLLGLVFVVCG